MGGAVWTDRARDDSGAPRCRIKDPLFGGRSVRGCVRSGSGCPSHPAGKFAKGNGQRQTVTLPGNPWAADYRPVACGWKLIPAGWDITFNLHYTPSGTPASDHVKVGFTVAKEPPERQYVSLLFSSSMDSKVFAIPPNNPDWLSPPVDVTFQEDVELAFMMTHMHFRGKDADVDPRVSGRPQAGGAERAALRLQLAIGLQQRAKKIPKGTKLHVDAHFGITHQTTNSIPIPPGRCTTAK